MNSALGRLRLVGYLEGTSFLLLLGVAMPLKYVWNVPEPVTVLGWLHGLLFVLYLLAAVHATIVQRWPLLRLLAAVIASLLPFGPFVFDARLRRAS
ncbi:DUF3817 domain-containing protein [Brevibacillus marinus]|uniref:DUF3817 domain-containing protein n=1 Tax=Brevibacillus marinus TaxID=2496837 RepID=UPI000F8296BA